MFSSYHGDNLVWEEVERLRARQREKGKAQAEQDEKDEREFVGPRMAFPVQEPISRHDDEWGDRHIKRLERDSERDELRRQYMIHRYNFPP